MLVLQALVRSIGLIILYLYRFLHVTLALQLLCMCATLANEWVIDKTTTSSHAVPPMSSTLSIYCETWHRRHLAKASISSKAKAARKFAQSRLLWRATASTWLYPTAVIWTMASLPSDPDLAASGLTAIRVLWFLWEACWLASILRYHIHLLRLPERPHPDDALSETGIKAACLYISVEFYLLSETGLHLSLDYTVIPGWLAGISVLNLFLLFSFAIVV